MACSLTVRVVPKSGKQRCVRDAAGTIKIYLQAAPEGGAANYELITFLAGSLRLPRGAFTILTGATARIKRIHIESSMSIDEVCDKLGLGTQQTLL